MGSLTRTVRDIYSVILGTTVLIVLSSAEVVNDLVDKRGSIYSSRPDMEMMRLLSGGENRMTFMVSVFNAVRKNQRALSASC